VTTTLFLLAAVLAGMASALQATTNGALAARIGLGSTLLVSITISAAAVLVLWMAEGGSLRGFFPSDASWPMYLGGVYGFAIIAAMALAFPRLGGAWTIALMVLGQGIMALAIDHLGLLGQPRDPITLTRLGGVALLVAGVLLMRWRW
jgi:transporter family-2 protein